MEDFSFVFGHPPAVDSSSWLAEQPVSAPDQRSNNVDSMLEEVPEQRSNNEHTTEIDLNEVPPMYDDVDQSFVIDPNEVAHDGLLSNEQIMAKKFDSEVEAYDWYRTYALVNGFGIRRDNRRSFDEFGQQIKSRIFLCARQGRRSQKYYDRPDRKREHRNDTRCSCTARLRIYRSSPTEQFCVKSFVREHAHELADRDVTYKLRCHRKVTDHDVKHVVSLREVGMRVCDTFQLAISQAGGYGKVGYMVKDLYNKLQSLRKAYFNSGDGQLALQYLDTLEHTNGGVFKRFTLGENDQLESIFWCDRRCQHDWARFGDVLVFDSTYKTNMYLKPVVILSGVNNHFQTTVFAVAILHNETTETYKWVLNCFMEAMSNKVPISVITDGDLAMKAAIAEIFPLARHRLCAWHLCRNAEGTLKLGTEFMKDFGKCLKKRSDINQWNDDWQYMVDKWRIANRKWVQADHMTRHLWAEAFLKDTFFAGQKTTQRCESINKFFKQHLKPTFNLQAFCQGFMWGLEKLRDNERGQHCISDQGNPVLSSQFKELEEHAAMYYTRAVFFKFKEQATKAADYTIVHFQPLDAYEIDAIYIRKNKENAALYTLFCQRDNNMVQCSCMRFESNQMLCAHIIFVLFCKGVAYIPKRLLSRRWEKTDREFYKNEPCMKEPVRRRCDDSATQSFRRGSMRGRMEALSNLGGTSQATFNFWKQGVETLILSLNNIIQNDDKNEPWIPNVNPEEYAHVKAPIKGETRSKGAPKNGQKKCGNCGQYGHNRTTCPNPPVGVGPSQPGSQAASQQSQQTVISNSYYSLSQGNSHPVLFRDEQVRWN